MRDLLINLFASALAGITVWSASRLARHRRQVRKQTFFGLDRDVICLLSVSRHASSNHDLSVHRRDVAAVVELATIAKDCGARVKLLTHNELDQGLGRFTEFCVGGPHGNERTGAHLRSLLPGVHVEPYDAGGDNGLPFSVGTTTYRRQRGKVEYGLLARALSPGGGRPVFLLSGQTARVNLAAARFLAGRFAKMQRRYGGGRFCLVLRVLEPAVYGADFVEVVADVTDSAFG